mgnify:FL=1
MAHFPLCVQWKLGLGMSDDTVALAAEAPGTDKHVDYNYYYPPQQPGTADGSPAKASGNGRSDNVGGSVRVDLGNTASVFKWEPPPEVPKEAKMAWSKVSVSVDMN